MSFRLSPSMGQPFVDTLDLVVLGGVLLGAVGYYFASRKANPVAYTAYKAAPPPTPSNGIVSAGDSLVDRMREQRKDLAVFFGSQTGTAEDFANRLASEAKMYGFRPLVVDLEEVEPDEIGELVNLKGCVAVFCVATYGEGDPTDNAIEFHQWMKDNMNGTDLTGLRFAVFGLGNSTYEHYQGMGRYVAKKMQQSGAKMVFPIGEGDDDKNIEEDFLRWKKDFLPALCTAVGREVPTNLDAFIPERQYELETHTGLPDNRVYTGEIGRHKCIPIPKSFVPDMKNPQLVPIRVNRELFSAEGGRSCRHIELDISNTRISYSAGDHVAIFPRNPPKLVDELGQLLGVDLDTVISLKAIGDNSSKKTPFPCPCTYRTALLHYVDICQLPKVHNLRELSQYCEGKDKEFLLRLTSEEGQEEYKQWVLNDMRSYNELLKELPTLRPPLDHLLEMMPRLQCRYFSISSSPKAHPKSIHITAVVVEYSTPVGRHVQGIATTYMRDLRTDDTDTPPMVPIYVRKSTFKLPRKLATPVIMIGPGTGVAPFRGFLQEREADSKRLGQPLGPTVLYYGCRNRKHDFLYEEELSRYLETGVLSGLELAFSRELEHKVYVTHHLERDRDAIWDMITNGGHIYVCGEARHMARDVQQIIRSLVMEKKGMSAEEVDSFIQQMQARGQYSHDVW